MNDIPADVARTAKEFSDRLPMSPDDDELEAAFARAIMAERERCANKAREYAAHYSEGSDGRNTFVLLAEWIEAGK